ncbi:MAG: hypothetical protein NZ742_11220, partial [Acidobacteria bacterium]|nr:hypothetical protein [Acidobacteriota bacterium]MDW7985266.1 hypothetical protein [Acidobacteriota bacterium]
MEELPPVRRPAYRPIADPLIGEVDWHIVTGGRSSSEFQRRSPQGRLHAPDRSLRVGEAARAWWLARTSNPAARRADGGRWVQFPPAS